ncbi:MAG TPA: hypothetical protein VEC17_03205 [Candidatus Binatia bacterium]|nr:hypothetical protein [Candidatus Binatia bacterium]
MPFVVPPGNVLVVMQRKVELNPNEYGCTNFQVFVAGSKTSKEIRREGVLLNNQKPQITLHMPGNRKIIRNNHGNVEVSTISARGVVSVEEMELATA